MSLQDKLAALEKQGDVPRIKTVDLVGERGYPIVLAKKIKTKHGDTIMIHVDDVDGGRACTFLPKRHVEKLDDADVAALNEGSYRIRCDGVSGKSPDVKIWKS